MDLHPGIVITSVKQPESGSMLALHCAMCKRTEFVFDPYGLKPSDGGAFFLLEGLCDKREHLFQIPDRVRGNAPIPKFGVTQ